MKRYDYLILTANDGRTDVASQANQHQPLYKYPIYFAPALWWGPVRDKDGNVSFTLNDRTYY
jgi:hypothetical protein